MERETGIEPALVAWKATVLPLNYSRPGGTFFSPNFLREAGGGRWIRTTEGMSQQIYSLPPLAAWVSLQKFSNPQFNNCLRKSTGRWMTPGILPFALRAMSLRDMFKIVPDDFVEPPKA